MMGEAVVVTGAAAGVGAPIVSGAGREMVRVANIDALEDGKLLLVKAAHAHVAIVRIGESIRAVSGLCTHARVRLAPGRLTAEGLIECPMHGAMFSPVDGSVRGAPATRPLEVYEVRVVDGTVYVDPGPEPAISSASSTSPGARASATQWGNWR